MRIERFRRYCQQLKQLNSRPGKALFSEAGSGESVLSSFKNKVVIIADERPNHKAIFKYVSNEGDNKIGLK